MTLTDKEVGYIAGIIDGEGTISMFVAHWGGHRRQEMIRGALSINSTDLNLLQWIADKTGVGHINERKMSALGKRKCYVWQVVSRKMVPLLRLIAPLLIVKRDRAELVLKLYGEGEWEEIVPTGTRARRSEKESNRRLALIEEFTNLRMKEKYQYVVQ